MDHGLLIEAPSGARQGLLTCCLGEDGIAKLVSIFQTYLEIMGGIAVVTVWPLHAVRTDSYRLILAYGLLCVALPIAIRLCIARRTQSPVHSSYIEAINEPQTTIPAGSIVITPPKGPPRLYNRNRFGALTRRCILDVILLYFLIGMLVYGVTNTVLAITVLSITVLRCASVCLMGRRSMSTPVRIHLKDR